MCRRRRFRCEWKSSVSAPENAIQHFRIGKARIRHMRVNGISSVKSVSGSGTSANGFIILQMVIAEGQIVHRALTRGHGTQCAKQRVTNRLTGLYIAGNHGGGRFGREQTTVWNFNMDGFEAPSFIGISASTIHLKT